MTRTQAHIETRNRSVCPGMERDTAAEAYRRIRHDSELLCEPLQAEDYLLQSMPQTSPPKWHLAHVSWFFETFLLQVYVPDYRPFQPQFRVLFNSYYEQVGPFHPRPQRGMLSRPTLEEIYRYRAWVDEQMAALIQTVAEEYWPEVALRIAIGLNHEQQHQELLLTDIKHNFWVNPLFPAYRSDLPPSTEVSAPLQWHAFEGGLGCIGQRGEAFAYDNEWPRHTVYVQPYQLASRLVNNGEFAAFIAEGGYKRPELWLSDGWATVQQQQWQAPLYWLKQDNDWWHFTLAGLQRFNEHEPVAHISYYEADAYARWAGHRLPTEQEWELAAAGVEVSGNLRDSGRLHPAPAGGEGLQQLFGDLWEWTASPYTPYPGYRAPAGALGEYNGKFMCNQMVLRGGSCATPAEHIRASYRNFFYPNERWQFKGFRLAEDV
ncbi:MAG: ergothioneine biosynthesis protein EgtB [Gammaproteobacteria bacterium]|nr:ergothioneine biosynthesis protein EgtB [Gammaproteobacteria bacterium]MCW8959123.1 ergothioneine biosynthesis protein EgtB [Gammaproteobacteria bacterium]MCW8972177.1 ergothioneine biosynthesis protein EgtB [Gammaproteobacteria bacterium]MCW8991827.1 ergothioneine biosynthesis protein EgtB [Gammaproteobacteria bacterium]